jgi:hypothetical protein
VVCADNCTINEVFQDKHYKAAISREDFEAERKKAATANDNFILFTSGDCAANLLDQPLPP